MRWLLVLAVCLVLTSVSGCLEAEVSGTDDPQASTSSSSSTTSASLGPASSSTSTKSSSTTSSKSPASLANATANLTASVLNGTAPLNVTFRLAGSAPGELAWTLVSNGTQLGKGASLPANVTHVFNQTGNVTVVLTVTGSSGNATARVTLSIAAAAAPIEPAEEIVLCPTDTAAIEIPGAGLYATPMDSLSSPPFSIGSVWIYEESNNMPGLQRNDDTMPTSCPTPDTIIF